MDIEPFLNYLKDVKRYSFHTLVAYKEDLEQFLKFCATKKDVFGFTDITGKIVREWAVIKMSEGMNATTVRRKLSALRTLFKYLMREGIVESDPTEVVMSPKMGKKLPVFVPDYQMDELLDSEALEGGLQSEGSVGFIDGLLYRNEAFGVGWAEGARYRFFREKYCRYR